MHKAAEPLTAINISRSDPPLDRPGLQALGTVAGLQMRVKTSGAKSWVLRTMIRTRRAEIGLGGYPTVTLAQAIEWTFKRCAEHYIAKHRVGWRNAKHAAQRESTLSTYAYPV